jgi:hypothetical protein
MTMPPEARSGHIVECNQCRKQAFVMDGGDIHVALVCPCCPEDHHHGQAAGNAAEGGTPCRPVTVYANAIATLAMGG